MHTESHCQSPSTLADLHRELKRSLAYAPEYASGLSSHLPMALQALHHMGASALQLQSFADNYTQRFADRPREPSPNPLKLGNWQQHLCRIESFTALQSHFAHELDQQGVRATVCAALPHLWPGLCGAAFHGLIRLRHALQSEHLGETASALAYWAARFVRLPVPNGAPPRFFASSTQWLAELERDIAKHSSDLEGQTIMRRMLNATQTDSYQRFAEALAVSPEAAPRELEALNAWAARLYADTGNFTVLHIVTGSRAIISLWPLLVQSGMGLQALLEPICRAVCAALLSAQTGPRHPQALAPASWPSLLAQACNHADDHAIKLVHSAWLGSKTQGALERRSAYSAAAQRALQGD